MMVEEKIAMAPHDEWNGVGMWSSLCDNDRKRWMSMAKVATELSKIKKVSETTSPSVLNSIGYDDWGNHADLLHPNDKAIIDGEIENGRYGKIGVPRAGGKAECKCGYPLEMHPRVQGALYFTRSCEGIVKL